MKKEALQELIDQTKTMKLEAEKDVDQGDDRRSRYRSRFNAKQQASEQQKQVQTQKTQPVPLVKDINKSEKYLKTVYGKDLIEKIKKTNANKFDWNQSDTTSGTNVVRRTDVDIFDRIITTKPDNVKTTTNTKTKTNSDSKPTVVKQEKVPVAQDKHKQTKANVRIVAVKHKPQALQKHILPTVNIVAKEIPDDDLSDVANIDEEKVTGLRSRSEFKVLNLVCLEGQLDFGFFAHFFLSGGFQCDEFPSSTCFSMMMILTMKSRMTQETNCRARVSHTLA